MDREIFFWWLSHRFVYYKWHNISLKIVFKRSHCFWISPSETSVSRARHASVKTWEGWGGGEGVDRAFLLDLSKVLRLPMLCRNKTTLLNAFSQKQPSCFHNCFSFYFSFISIYIFLFLVRDLRFNNISVISNGDLAQLRYLTTLWVILSFSTLITLIWLVLVVVIFTVQFVTYL